MCLKVFSLKIANFKNPISALFKQTMITIFGFLDSFLRPIIEKKIFEKKLLHFHQLRISLTGEDKVIEEKEKEKGKENEDTKEKLCQNKELEDNEDNKDYKDNEDYEGNNQIKENENEENLYPKENIIFLQDKYNDPKSRAEIEAIKINTDDIDISELTNIEIYQSSLLMFKNLIQIAEGKKKEWIVSNIYSKCLGFELLSGVICQSGWAIKYLPDFINLIKNDLHKVLKKNFEATNDYIIGLKISRLTIYIIQNCNFCYDLIPYLLKYAENQLTPWQKLIGIECITSICGNNLLLKDLYEKKFSENEKNLANIYDDLINCLTKVSYNCVTNKQNEQKKAYSTAEKKQFENLNNNSKHPKNIENSMILTEADAQIPNYPSALIIKLITEAYHNIRDSYVIMLEIANVKLGHINKFSNDNSNLNKDDYENRKEQILIREIILYNYEIIKNAMTALILNSTDDAVIQSYLMIFQSYINIFGSIDLPISRDSYLNDLCKLAIPNNMEKSFELNSRNILITKTLFNIAHCVNILDSNSWLLLIETMQKIYLLLINTNNHQVKPNEEFDIDIVIKNLEENIRKFKPNYKIKENLTIENDNKIKENIEDNKDLEKEINLQKEEISNNFNNAITSTETTEKRRGIFSTLKGAFGFGGYNKNQKNEGNNIQQISSKKNIVNNEDSNMDFQILSGAIDTLFINSLSYEEDTLKDITKAFLESSKIILSKNLGSNDVSNIYINFNLTKLLELAVINIQRIPLFWEGIIDLIEFIANKNASNISRFSLDCLTIINMFLLTGYETNKSDKETNNQNDENIDNKIKNKNNNWDSDNWQNTIFKPFKTIAQQNISQMININIIYNLCKILQNSGSNFNYQGWNNLIQICEILVSKNDEVICENVFKLIEQIINEYSEYLTLNNINSLLDSLEIFSQYKKNTNISFISVTMFWNISSIAEKFTKLICLDENELINDKDYQSLSNEQKNFFEKNKEKNIQFNLINKIWLDFFSKIVGICSDNIFDVRKSAINIFADIFVAKNTFIQNEISIEIINKYFLEIMDKSYSLYEEKMKFNRSKATSISSSNENSNSIIKTPKFSEIKDIKIGDFKVDQLKIPGVNTNTENIKKDDFLSTQKIQPSAEEVEWEDTTILLVQALGKVLRAFLSRNINSNKDFSYYNENLINSVTKKYCKIIRMATPKLAGTILGSLQEIYNSNIDLFMNQFENFWKIYEEMGNFITTDFYLNNLCTMASSSKMISTVLEILKEIFLKESNLIIKPDLLEGKNLNNLLNFTTMLIKSSKNSEGVQFVTNPQKLLFDEKIIFEFVEKISKTLNNPKSWGIYLQYLCDLILFDINYYHSEAHCRKSLELFDTFLGTISAKLYNTEEINLALDDSHFGNGDLQKKDIIILEFLDENIPKLFDCVKDLCSLRNNNEYVNILLKNNKSQMQIWHFGSFQLIKILSSLLCKNNKKKEDENKEINNNKIKEIEDKNENKSNNKFIEEYNLKLNNIWESSIRCFESIFRQSEQGYKNISRNLLDELLKSCQDMEIQIIYFIVNSLLPNSLRIPKEMQIKLLNLLDMGSNFDYNTMNNLSQSSSGNSSISRVCIENLFELCKYRTEEALKKEISSESVEFFKLKSKISKMSTPILIKRCREALKRYLDDEIKSGSMPLARSRLNDIKYILEKLKNLEIYPNYLNYDDDPNFNKYTVENVTMMDLVLKNKKSHLFQLMPLLSEFITSKENDIKMIVKDIFRLINNEIGIK